MCYTSATKARTPQYKEIKMSVDPHFVEKIRRYELDQALSFLKDDLKGKKVLEIGSGSGVYLRYLADKCDIVGVDVEDGTCVKGSIDNVVYYDGHTLPFESSSFDVILSNSVLEHIPHLDQFHKEMQRVLKDDGLAVHILPTHWWRFWTSLVHYIALPIKVFSFVKRRITKSENQGVGMAAPVKRSKLELLYGFLAAGRHGETGNRFTELYYFHPSTWTKVFQKGGWCVCTLRTLNVFYTDYSLFGAWLSLPLRAKLSQALGSSVCVLTMRKTGHKVG